MGGNDPSTKSSIAVTKRKINKKKLPVLKNMFEIDISDDESDSKHTQEAQNESVVTDPKIQNNQDPMEDEIGKMRLSILVQSHYLKKQSIQGMKTQQKSISKKNL